MKIFATIIATLLLLGVAEQADAATTWRHYGADPAYRTREAAIADAPRVFLQQGMPSGAIKLLKEAMKHPGDQVHIVNGMHLAWMRSGPHAVWHDVLVKFDRPGKGAEVIVNAEQWSVTWEGQVWTVVIPKSCNNLLLITATPPPPPPVAKKECAFDIFEAQQAEEVALQYAVHNDIVNSDGCGGYAIVSTLDKLDATTIDWKPLSAPCPDHPCSFWTYDNFLRTVGSPAGPRQMTGTIPLKNRAQAHVYVVIRVSKTQCADRPQCLVVGCMTWSDGTIRRTSNTTGLGVVDYVNNRARAYHAAADVPAELQLKPRGLGPRDRYLWP